MEGWREADPSSPARHDIPTPNSHDDGVRAGGSVVVLVGGGGGGVGGGFGKKLCVTRTAQPFLKQFLHLGTGPAVRDEWICASVTHRGRFVTLLALQPSHLRTPGYVGRCPVSQHYSTTMPKSTVVVTSMGAVVNPVATGPAAATAASMVATWPAVGVTPMGAVTTGPAAATSPPDFVSGAIYGLVLFYGLVLASTRPLFFHRWRKSCRTRSRCWCCSRSEPHHSRSRSPAPSPSSRMPCRHSPLGEKRFDYFNEKHDDPWVGSA